ncbi:MAG: DoxX family protein [Bacteroidales bacterium]|jgi:putative oxidoreductase|nr:DoxX family protein [Bacteroidales bacterium]MDD3273629.1 DoxX family protein [Bacteroidales bacterium]MDD4057369.1 DoxX family protein [Bacteroidales bacterium]
MKKFLFFGAPVKENVYSLALLLIRVAAGLLMMTHGWSKIQNFEGMVQSGFDPIGVGATLSVVLLIGAEFAAALFIVLGLLTRLSVIPLIVAMSVASFVAHAADPLQVKELSLIYLTIFTSLFISGAGRYSLDSLFFKKR